MAQPAAVNYEQLFDPEEKPDEPKQERSAKVNQQRILLPLHAQNIKNFTDTPFSCEFTTM